MFINLWKFNEGKNFIVKDLVVDVVLFFLRYLLGKLEWVFFDVFIVFVVIVNLNEDNVILYIIVIKVCFEFIYEGLIYLVCNVLGNVILEFYFCVCV